MDRKTVSKLKLAFWNKLGVSEACAYAGISVEAYKKALAENGKLAHQMTLAQMYQSMRAHEKMSKEIVRGNGTLAMKWLERREPERYNPAYILKYGKSSEG
ncbi:MAG: hypothetical protein PHE68_02545 [Candidatus Peribacteraceae bacterium]|nr:hypothetical protein [Candidatus Peribacteraceae bacterium]